MTVVCFRFHAFQAFDGNDLFRRRRLLWRLDGKNSVSRKRRLDGFWIDVVRKEVGPRELPLDVTVFILLFLVSSVDGHPVSSRLHGQLFRLEVTHIQTNSEVLVFLRLTSLLQR